MKLLKSLPILLSLIGGVFQSLAPATAVAAVSQVPTQTPLFVNASTPPLNMLVVGRDHKLFYPAYNDASDLDNDGAIEFRYKPAIDYFGYFDSYKCYSYTGANTGGTDNDYFYPVATTADKTCSGSAGRWSGNFLNYMTTSRIDALRKVLYGGYRTNAVRTSPENTTPTILERAYIRADAHTWGKQYNSYAFDGYHLADFTPLTEPDAGKYTIFANTNTSVTGAPKFRILVNRANLQVYGWVAREVTEGQNTQSLTNGSGTTTNYSPDYDFNVRVQVCKPTLLESNCVAYPNGNYKPTGLLHDYGSTDQMFFGLMTGTYQNNLSGGVLRKAISSFSGEVDPSTGIFGKASTTGGVTTYTKQGIIATLDALRIQDASLSGNYSGGCNTDASCMNWGNPLGEIMYESLRYFSGAATPTAAYAAGAKDTAIGLPSVTPWVDPYSQTASDTTVSHYPSCSKPFNTVISDVNPNFDSALPGSAFGDAIPADSSTALSALNVSTLGQAIWTAEYTNDKKVNIGQSGATATDDAPTSKNATSFGNIRGLPEEPAKQGTYNTASVAYYGNTHFITSAGSHNIKTFAVALSSTLPKLQIPVGTNTITLLPYGRVVANGPIVTEEIAGFYIESLTNMPGGTYNGSYNGLPHAVFRVIYDDAAAGADYDEDETVRYELTVNPGGTLTVATTTEYASAGYESHIGFTASGTTADGIYLEVTGGGGGTATSTLDTPGTLLPSACSVSPKPSGCVALTSTHTRTLTPSTTSNGITNLMNPLWYAAKWGGYSNSSDPGKNSVNASTDLPVEKQWDSNIPASTANGGVGTPDNYFMVTNATTLKAQLSKAFNLISQTNTAVSAPAVSPSLSDSTTLFSYSTQFDITKWSGDVVKTTVTTAPNATLTQLWKASAVVPDWGSRKIMMANSSVNTAANAAYGSTNPAAPSTTSGTGLQAFSYSGLSGLSYAGSAFTTTLNSSKVDFIKGDISNATTYRSRTSLIGDIVDSAPKLVSTAQYLTTAADSLDGSGTYAAFKATQATRRAQVYVGANDGMLHGFDATTGVEKFAFIPTAVINKLSALTAPTYNTDSSLHQFYVDGTPVVADVYFAGAWHTILVGTLGAGGREIFALDVTDPDNIKLLWEFTSQNDSRLGYTFATPVVSKLHDGHWGVIFGNGYNSDGGTSTLFILDAATGTRLNALVAYTPATGADADGLSSPRVMDVNSDGVADYVYAGDLLGKLWRFDLYKQGANMASQSAVANSDFKVAFGTSNPLYSAKITDSGTTVQSITAPPSVVQHPSKTGVIVIFGTGRFFTTADKTNMDLQTLYGVWDKTPVLDSTTLATTPTTTPSLTRANLQAQTITSQVTAATFGTNTYDVRMVSTSTVDWTSKYGWTLDLKVSSLLGERIVDPMVINNAVLYVSTRTPPTDACSTLLQGWVYGLDPTTGGATAVNIFNLSSTGTPGSSDSYKNQVVSGFGTPAGGITIVNNELFTPGVGTGTTLPPGGSQFNRQTWRIIPAY